MNKYTKNIVYLIALIFFIRVVLQINLSLLIDTFKLGKLNFLFALLLLAFSQLTIGIIWSMFLKEIYNINFKLSFKLWINSVAAKYIPGKIASPILRIENTSFKNNKIEFYNHILIENLILVLLSISIGFYVFISSSINIFLYFLIINLIFFGLFKLQKIKIKKINLQYFKNIFYLEVSSLLNIFGIYLITLPFNLEENFELSLMYVFVSGVSMLVFIVPAGIGIRENIFIQIGDLKNFNENILASLSIILRISTILVDIFFVIFSLIFNSKFNHSK